MNQFFKNKILKNEQTENEDTYRMQYLTDTEVDNFIENLIKQQKDFTNIPFAIGSLKDNHLKISDILISVLPNENNPTFEINYLNDNTKEILDIHNTKELINKILIKNTEDYLPLFFKNISQIVSKFEISGTLNNNVVEFSLTELNKDISDINDFTKKFGEENTKQILEDIVDSFYEKNIDLEKHGIKLLTNQMKSNENLPEGHMEDNLYGEFIINDKVIYFSITLKTDNVFSVKDKLDLIEVEDFYLDRDETKKYLNNINKLKTAKKMKNW
jgi:hypothetical protein